MIDFNKIETFVFDCDGVIFDSNQIKSDAFYEIGKKYSEEVGLKLSKYHEKNGGESRYKKFSYLFDSLLNIKTDQDDINRLSKIFANLTIEKVLNSAMAEGIFELRKKTKNKKWLVVSGSDQKELREIFYKRNLEDLFDGGIYGSPDTKDIILKRELESGNIKRPSLFIGDSITDFKASQNANMSFIFLSRWSGITNWKNFLDDDSLVLDSLDDLVSFF